MRISTMLVLAAACHGDHGAHAPDAGADAATCSPASYVNGPQLAEPAPPTSDPVVHPISRSRLVARFDHAVAPTANAGDWSVTSADDAAYATPQRPTGIAVKTRAAALTTDTWPYGSIPEHEVVIELPHALTPGATYTLAFAQQSWTFSFAPDTQWTPAIELDQIGYLSTAAGRHAYLGYWLGDGLAPMTLAADETHFHVVDATSGQSVLEGDATLRLAFDAGEDAYGTNYSHANVYDLDLTPLATPGDYYIVWDGVGRSPTFRIGPDVFDTPFITVFRGLLHQRCGIDLTGYTQWAHGACHLVTVHATSLDYQVIGEDAYGQLPPADTGETIDAHGGYHDAGDYDKNYGHMLVVDDLIDLYEIAPAKLARDDLGLPESGNLVPDVIDEATWALDYWAQLQEPDGGVHAGVGTTGPPAWTTMPDQDTASVWYAYATDPVATYWFAGAAAKLSRAVRAFDAAAADTWLARAEHAWTWAEANRRSYSDRGLDAYAAAELFKTTGTAAYETAFASYVGTIALDDGSPDDTIPALYAYATTANADPMRKAMALAALEGRAASWVAWAKQTGYRLVKNPYAPVNYGSYTTPRDAGLLFRVHSITHDPELLEWGTYACDESLGANADGLSWTTGLGAHAVQHPLQIPSIADGIDAPVPGLTVYGPSSTTSAGGIEGSVLAAYDPAPAAWPVSNLYADVSYSPILNEFTVHDSIAPTAFAFGYLATLAPKCP
ncbi:MAG: glycoside hydrolase family 9 protein [Acidobacteriota bacterium]